MSIGPHLTLIGALAGAQLLAGPAIAPSGISNAASYAGPGTLNGGIAQGSAFVIFGTGLGPDTLTQVTDFPLGPDVAGVTVRVTSGTTAVNAYPLYVSPSQIGAIHSRRRYSCATARE